MFTSTNDSSHEQGAQIFARILYLADTEKRKQLLDGVFGKQNKIKGRNEYALHLEQFLAIVYPGYAQQTDAYLNQFVGDLLTYLEPELQAISEFYLFI